MANSYTKVTPQMEQQNKYYDALKKWKKEKPTIKSMFNNQMGAYGSDLRKNNQAKLDKATADWKAKEPKKSDFTSTSAPSATKTQPKAEPKTQPKAEPKKDTPATKEADKINKDLSSVKQKGASSFLRSLLPSKDRLSPSQRMAKAGKSKGQILRKRLGK
jgi:hypothetical protein